ncbi:subtilisin-like serine protease QhpE [Metapseudomonas boanensis]|uniref:Peptidase S8 and S53 subtilisin kexin sedolisin n=1 Tax=Metapseudomonas boanensis TaxID=2822138 RepID=A0ABS5XCT2_9GAMM|nr:peptidase S8 and S53 subtilisin kexin sedolisin [Pseudomonas boanensis]MBT8764976.1 peptidase S8 and S53 subtilisin kexin sedolisin [Pseudomonas boanensis]
MAAELRVGIIDSGYAPSQANQVLAARRFWLSEDGLADGEALPDALGHGSAILDTLTRQAGPLELYVAQVFGDRWQTSPLQIAGALHWLIEQDVALVNLSLGLRNDRPVLREACALAQVAGILLCASSPAQGEPVYPASYPGVIRVTGDARCAAGQWSWLNSPQADFGAPVAAVNGVAGASVGCAALCGMIAGNLQRHPGAGRDAVLAWLRDGAAFVGPERRGRRDD